MSAITLALLALTITQDADVVVMRRAIAPPQRTGAPASTPTPTPTPAATPTPTPGPAAAWNEGTWGDWTPTCNKVSSRTRTVQCRQGGNVVADTACTAPKPDTTENGANTISCTFTPTYSAYGACTNSTHSATLVSCQRSDGESVPVTACGNNPQTISEICTVTPQCGTMVVNVAVGGYDTYQGKGLSTGQLGPALTEATAWCASVRADACQADVGNGFVLAYFGAGTQVYGPGSANNGRHAAACTH